MKILVLLLVMVFSRAQVGGLLEPADWKKMDDGNRSILSSGFTMTARGVTRARLPQRRRRHRPEGQTASSWTRMFLRRDVNVQAD